jgi:WD40 repeat protein
MVANKTLISRRSILQFFLRHVPGTGRCLRTLRWIYGRRPQLGQQAPLGVFISYARKDQAFADRLVASLLALNLEVWIDRREIAPSADWLQRIVQGIVESRFFAFVVSPDSVVSEMCSVELRQAVSLHKPMVPILWRRAVPPEELTPLQWSDFTESANYEVALDALVAALNRDPEWLAAHARYATAAAAWSAGNRRWYFLLQGGAIAEARQWLVKSDGRRRLPTELQKDFIAASRRFSRRWRASLAGILLVLVPAAAVVVHDKNISDRETAARSLASRAVQLRNEDQSALVRSAAMLAEATAELSELSVRAPEIDAELRRSMHFLLRPRGDGIHPSGVGGLAVDPKRSTLATFALSYSADVSAGWNGKVDQTVRLWDAPSQSAFATLQHEAPVGAAAFDSGNHLITGTMQGGILFWNVDAVRGGSTAAEHEVRPPDGGTLADGIVGVAGSQTEALAVTASGTGLVCAWNTERGARRWCKKHSDGGGLVHVAISPDGHIVAAGGAGGLIELRRTLDGELLQPLRHRSNSAITSLSFSPGSNQLASGDEKGEFHFWNVDRGQDEDVVAHREAVTEIAYASADAVHPYVATTSRDGSLRILDRSVFSSVQIEEFPADYALWHIAIDPTGRLIAVARGDGFVDIWGRAERHVIGRVRIPSGDIATGMAFLAGDLLAIVDGGEGVRFVEPTAGRDAWQADSARDVQRLAVSPSGFLAEADFAGDGSFLQLAQGAPAAAPQAASALGALGFGRNGSAFAAVDDQSDLLRVLHLPDGAEIARWPVPTNVGAVAWHPSKDAIAVGKRDGGVWIRDVAKGAELRHAEIGSIGLSFAADKAWLAIVDPDKGLYIWDVDGLAPPKAVDGGDKVEQAIFLMPQSLITAEKSGRVRLWQTASQSEDIASLHLMWSADACPVVKAVAASREGELVAVGCDDGRIIVWRAATGQVEANIAYPGKVGALAFAPVGNILVAGGSTGLQGFLLAPNDLIAETCGRISRNLRLSEWLRDVGRGSCRRTCPSLPGCD